MGIAICAGLLSAALWGIMYIFPLLLPGYSSFQTGIARCVVTGLFSIILLVVLRKEIRLLNCRDWILAGKLALIGTMINFLAQVYCSEFAGSSIAGMSTGIIPVVLTVLSNERDRRLGRWSLELKKLLMPLVLITFGFVLCNYSEFVTNPMHSSPVQFCVGVCLGLLHTAIWTWYPVVNSDWLQTHPRISALAWTSAIFSLLLPLGVISYLIGLCGLIPGVEMTLLGPNPKHFIVVMLIAGICSSWGGMMGWNYMCKRIPTSLAGQMMIFETLFAIAFAHILLGRFPAVDLLIGVILLSVGVTMMFSIYHKNKDSIERSVKKIASENLQ